MTSVDVFVPCYNYGRFLERCVDSVLSQDGVEVRVLIIDDASTDSSLVEARRLAARDSRVFVLPHPVNKGHIATYNDGIAWASAPYVMLLSADDLLAPQALLRSTALMGSNPGVGFVFGRLCEFDDSAQDEAAMAQATTADLSESIVSGQDFIAGICHQPKCLVPASGVIVRTELQQRVGGYLPELPHAGDLEMWLRLAAHADVGVLQAPTAFTRVHTTNMRHSYTAERMIGDYRQRALVFRMFFERQARQLIGREFLAKVARRSLAMEVLAGSGHAFDKRDDAYVARLAELAREIDPTIVRTVSWWRTVVKRTIGWEWCQRFSQAKAALRRVAAIVRRKQVSSEHGALQSASSSLQGGMSSIQRDVP